MTLLTDLSTQSFRALAKEWMRLAELISKYNMCWHRHFAEGAELSDRCWGWERLFGDIEEELNERYRSAFNKFKTDNGYLVDLNFGDLLA